MYMASYCGTKSRTFNVWDTIQEAKIEAEKHAIENSRLKGYYRVCEGKLSCGNLFGSSFKDKTLKGVKRGKAIDWED